MIAFRRPPSLRNLLVRAEVPPTNDSSIPPIQHGMFMCTSRCVTCQEHILQSDSFKSHSTGAHHMIRGHITHYHSNIIIWYLAGYVVFSILVRLRTHLTPLLRRPCIHAIFFPTACRTACKHAFRFLRVFPEAVSTCHSWLWQTLDDVYTRRCFAESEGTRFGAPGQKALPSMNEFTLLWIFA